GHFFEEARRHLDECQRLQGGATGNSLALQRERVLLRTQLGDFDDIENGLWRYAHEDKKDAPLVLEALAQGYWMRLRLPMALSALKALTELEPNNARAWRWYGMLLVGTNHSVEAVKAFEKAVSLNPRSEEMRLSLARVLLDVDPKEARVHFEILVRGTPAKLEYLAGLALAHGNVGDPDAALSLLEQILQKDPSNPAALLEK